MKKLETRTCPECHMGKVHKLGCSRRGERLLTERIERLERTVVKLTHACDLLNARMDGQADMMRDLQRIGDLISELPKGDSDDRSTT